MLRGAGVAVDPEDRWRRTSLGASTIPYGAMAALFLGSAAAVVLALV